MQEQEARELDRLWRSVTGALFGMVRQTALEQGLPAQFMGMMHKLLASDGVTVSELARRTGLAKSHVSKTVDRLAQMGLAEKLRDGADRRLVRVAATADARERFRQVHGMALQRWAGLVAAMPPDQVQALVSGLRALEAALAEAGCLDRPPDAAGFPGND